MSQEADGETIIELSEIILGPNDEIIFDSDNKGQKEPIKEENK